MVVAEFTDANDTHPKVVAGTEPSGEQTTATGQSSTSTYAEKAASGKSIPGFITVSKAE